jgi:hypothetical protein
MLKRLFGKLLAWKLGKGVLVPLAQAQNKVKGKKTEILLGLLCVVYLLEVLGVVPAGSVDEVKTALGAASLPTLLEKLRDHEDVVKEILHRAEAADKQLED